MVTTEYATLTTEELIKYCLLREGKTSLEVELAQRLESAVDLIRDVFTTERFEKAEHMA